MESEQLLSRYEEGELEEKIVEGDNLSPTIGEVGAIVSIFMGEVISKEVLHHCTTKLGGRIEVNESIEDQINQWNNNVDKYSLDELEHLKEVASISLSQGLVEASRNAMLSEADFSHKYILLRSTAAIISAKKTIEEIKAGKS